MNPATYDDPRIPSGDAVAEAAVDAVMRSRSSSSKKGDDDILNTVERLADEGDHACRAFSCAAFMHPGWVDLELLQAGQHVGLALAAPTGAVLLLGGLMEVYSVPSIATVLDGTQRLSRHTWQRMLQTGRFIRDIHCPGSLAPCGEGLRSIARIRLIHAMVRMKLAAQGRDVLTPTEMSFTLCAHSHVVRRGLASLGVDLTARETRAHQHLWRVVGHFMGIDPRVLPRSPHAERALYQRLYPQLVDGEAEASQRLANSAIDAIAGRARVPAGLVRATVHRLVGSPLATKLGAVTSGRWSVVLNTGSRVAAAVNRMRRMTPMFTSAFARTGSAFANAVLAQSSHSTRTRRAPPLSPARP